MFTEESLIAQLWVKWINKGVYTTDQVPDLYNLKETVEKLIKERTYNE